MKGLKKLAFSSIVIAGLNQVAYPLFGVMVWEDYSKKGIPFAQEVDNFLLNRETTPHNLSTLISPREFITLANSYVHRAAGASFDCKDYSIATMHTYHSLIDNASRHELHSHARIVSSLEMPDKQSAHMWMEIQENGSWIPYEPSDITPQLSLEDVTDYSIEKVQVKSRINGFNDATKNVHFTGYLDSKTHSIKFLPTLRAFTYPGGLVRVTKESYDGAYDALNYVAKK